MKITPEPKQLNLLLPLNMNDKRGPVVPYLIEASAGTGKTYSITYLFLHAILQEIPLEKILIMTFTEAATAELRERIVASLNTFSQEIALNNDENGDKPLSCQIADQYFSKENQDSCQRLLRTAQSQLDLLQIYTIHGFCNKVLKTNAFESGLSFNCELVKNATVLEEVVKNEWRHLILTRKTDCVGLTFMEFSNVMNNFAKTFYYPKRFKKFFEEYKSSPPIDSLQRVHKNFFDYKATHNLIAYDDMINLVYNKIIEPNSSLKDLLRDKYQVVMLDEFQDTDEKQLAIFDQIFNDQKHGMFMIGDPKQSIYEFRGADLSMYFRAKEEIAKEILTLNKNYRSSPQVVNAVNALFSRPNAFGLGDLLNFYPTEAAKKDDPSFFELKINGQLASGLVFQQIENKDDTKTQILEEIKFLYQNAIFENQKGECKHLKFSDFVILVNANSNAEEMVEACRKEGLPAVLKGITSVFNTEDAITCYSLIKLILHFSEENLKEVLFSDLYCKTPQEIITQDYTFLGELFQELKHIWNEKGLASVWYHLSRSPLYAEQGGPSFKSFITSQEQGERKYGNYEHIIEILCQKENEIGIDPEGTLLFLNKLLINKDLEKEEYIIRLDSDLDAVQVITMHSSKGLEYPIVFSLNLDTTLHYNKEESEYPTAMQERLRLAYVTLTRAKNRNYVYLTEDENKIRYLSPIFYLLFKKDSFWIEIMKFCTKKYNQWRKTTKNQENPAVDFEQQIIQTAQTLARNHRDLISFCNERKEKTTLILDHKEVKLKEPETSKLNIKTYDVASFSGLTQYVDHVSHYFNSKENDEISDEEQPIGEPEGIYALPKGATFGSCVHEIFENYFKEGELAFYRHKNRYLLAPMGVMKAFQPAKTKEAQKKLLQRQKDLEKMITQTLTTPFQIDKQWITLGDIIPQDAKVEMEFFYYLTQLTPEILATIFSKHGREDLSQACRKLRFSPKQGYMTGFIDLLFRQDNRYFIVDWKTNYLGHHEYFYTSRKIAESVLDSWYFLQYHIYCVAVNLFLKKTLRGYDYQQHFGGVAYVYVRGRQGDCGIFTEKPSQALIEELEQYLTIGTDPIVDEKTPSTQCLF